MGAKQAREENESNKHNKQRTVSFKLDSSKNNNGTVQNELELDSLTFAQYAVNHFQYGVSSEYTKELIDHALLKQVSLSDEIAALAVWITIQRFMGDLNDIETNKKSQIALDKIPIIDRVSLIFQQSLTKKDFKNAQRHSKIIEKQIKLEKQISTNPFLVIIKSSSFLEKVHLITSVGILRPELRDEIYCQLCKQLTNNQNKISFLRGWILMSLCIGCFAPSNQFLDCLFDFIRKGPNSLSKYCFVRLKRTLANGSRIQPPSFLEFKAAKSFQILVLPITFIDGSQETLYADSATTSKELVDSITRKLNLKYNFDFSINISIYDQMSSLGYGDNHVLDAISECEQYAKIKTGTVEQRAPWQLFFNKDISSNYEDYLVRQLPIYGADYGESSV